MSVKIEVPFKYPDQKEPIIYRDANVLKRCHIIEEILKVKRPNWETEGIKLAEPMEMLWPKATVEFCLSHAHRYTLPNYPEEPNLEEYKEAMEKTLDELKDIAACAVAMECSYFFSEVLEYVIAKKLDGLSEEKIDEFYGIVPRDDRPNWFWITVFSIFLLFVVILVCC